MTKVLRGGNLILPQGIYKGSIVFDERIRAIYYENDGASDGESDEHIIDVTGLYIAPGFIDVHIHGCAGADVMDATVQSLDTLSKTVIQTGTTRFLATTMTMDLGTIYRSLDAVSAYMGHESGAKILGVHLEGPFISSGAAGAQNATHILRPDSKTFEAYEDLIKIVTYAPEEDFDYNFTKHLSSKNIAPSIGHTRCTSEQALSAVSAGAKGFTHLFNAMTPLHHRNPGAVGAALMTDTYVELIADNVHVHPLLFSVVEKAKSPDRMILITDAMRASCLKDGSYDLGGQEVFVKGAVATLKDGTLAGSTLNQMLAIKHMSEHTRLGLHEIVKMVTLTPATYLGFQNVLGSLDVGKFADIVVFNHDFEVEYAFVDGECVYKRSVA